MPFWFSNKVTTISRNPVDPGSTGLNLWEESRLLYNKYYPNLNVSGIHEAPALRSESSATREWIMTALRSSTGQDRLFAMAYLVTTHPMLSLRYLDSLIASVVPSKQRDCIRAIEVTHQLFVRSLLPSQRILVPFDLRPVYPLNGVSVAQRSEILCLWYFEDQLKSKYLHFIKALERLLLSDTVEGFKRKALNALSDLAVKSPEIRGMVVGIIVNKLGDRSKVLASSVIHRLRIMVKKRFHMSAVIVQEIRSFLFRPNLPERAKYYAVVFLSSLQLRNNPIQCTDDSIAQELPVTVVKIYTAFFNATTKTALPEKLVAVLLTGLNRAVPFVSESRFEEVLVDVDNIFSLVHRSSCSISLQALAVLFQLSSCRVNIRGRYYQTLYRKLRDPEILHTSKGPSLLHLLYRSMLADPEVERLCAFTQRLLQLCLLYCSPGFVVGTLILLGKVSAVKKDMIVLNQVPVKFQVNANELKLHDPVSLSLTGIGPNGDDEEHFSDAPDSAEEDELSAAKSSGTVPLPTEPMLASWDHRELSKTMTGNHHKDHPAAQRYRPDAREPLFARAGGQPSWPLILLASHSHPTVALLATNLLQGKSVTYTGNPFDDFSLVHFLDRFAYKKPKANAKSKHNAPPGRVVQRKAGVTLGPRALPVNSASFRQLSLDRIAADEQFFHTYFTFLTSRTGKVANKRSGNGDESDGSVSDDEFDAYLAKHERGLIPTGDELDDEAMDELGASYHRKEKKSLRSSIPDPDDENLSEDDDDFSDHIDAYEEEDGDDGSDDEFTLKNAYSSPKLSDLFASADEIGHLYAARETGRERRQRLWEQKRAADLSPRSDRFNRKRVGGEKSRKPGRMPIQIKKKGSKRRRCV
ncbi:hypothetical protein CRM22_011148 [Opisthorchis felineus]|uniref:CCAAT-binding factor domain-containing protein n=1 Tax=Opisthorchis felineus TaxID=147828 RepID=A0A4S2K9Q1_OPIFE|nr:hypothetical protein CRM22_011148 [Opisthorchis felineus]